MNKRIQKRHDRKVARAKQRVRLSEPDLRTPEQVRAAREASRPATGRHNDPLPHYGVKPAVRRHAAPAVDATVKGEF
jgi:hypothetical protein